MGDLCLVPLRSKGSHYPKTSTESEKGMQKDCRPYRKWAIGGVRVTCGRVGLRDFSELRPH